MPAPYHRSILDILYCYVLVSRPDPQSRPTVSQLPRSQPDPCVEPNPATADLARANDVLTAVVDTTPFATLAFDQNRNLTFWNAAAERIFGMRADEVIGSPFPAELMPDSETETARERVDRTLAGATITGEVVRRRSRDGRPLTLEIYAAPILDADGRSLGYAGQMIDVTERDRARAELDRLAAAVEQTIDGVVMYDGPGRIVYVNPAYERQSHYRADELLGRHHADFVSDSLGAAIDGAIRGPGREGRPWFGEVARRTSHGSGSLVQLSMTPVHDQSGAATGFVVVQRDVTDLRLAEADLALEARIRAALAAAVHDGGPESSLEHGAGAICDELATVPGVDFAAVGVFLAPDEIAVVASNGTNGLPALVGHGLPRHRARRIQEQVGGGPWAVPWRALSQDGAWGSRLTAAGLKAFAFAPIVHGDHVDGGAVIGTRDTVFARKMIETQPGMLAFGTTSSALLADRLHARRAEVGLRRSLDVLLAERAFHVVFQPIVDLQTRAVVAYEALSRFDSGRRPDLCFADAWSVGLGAQLELATLQAAIEAARLLPGGRWLDLNVSPRLLVERDRLRDILWSADRPLVLEITEHEPVADYEALHRAVRSLGGDIRLAVDDAGAGVANFGHLVDLGADFVKIDTSLVRRVNANLGRQALVVGMRHFARTAGCRLVAEGVETEDEARTLTELGVEFGQGYLFGHPVTADRLA